MARKIAVSTNKGGVLKTSIVTSLAGILATEGYKILVIDTDNQGNAALSFGLVADDCEKTIHDCLIGGTDPAEAAVNVYPNIDILPANDNLELFDYDVWTNLDSYQNPFYLLKNIMQDYEANYDIILMDTPPSMGLIQGNVMTYTDEVLIPFQPETFSMRSLVKVLNFIRNFKEVHNPNLSVLGVIATMVDTRTVLHSEVLQQARRYCLENNLTMFDTVIPRTIRSASSVAFEGLPVTLSKERGSSELKSAYYELLGEIADAE